MGKLLSERPLHLAGSFFLISLIFRIVDIFILEMNATDFGILPSKVIPLILILLYLRHSERKRSDIGIHSKDWRNNVVLAILTIVVFNGVLIGGNFLTLFILDLQPQLSIYKMDYIVHDLVFQTANTFMEEILFRGLMLISFMAIIRPGGANLLQGFLFGLWHVVWPINSYLGGLISAGAAIGWSIEYALSSMTIGLLFGYMFLKTGSLISPILLHFFVNLLSGYVSIAPSITVIKLGFGALALLLAFVVVLLYTRRKSNLERCS
jgi:membrane protease YdiL (CAAX protease family)